MTIAYTSTAYLWPVQLYAKYGAYDRIFLETEENYLKQTYRNRCVIAVANGTQVLTVPIVKPDTVKCLTRDIRISDHGNWRHLHWNALVSAYRMSPFFEYYADDFAPFYEKKYEFLLDFNERLRELVCDLIDIHPDFRTTSEYLPHVEHDFRERISPKSKESDPSFVPVPGLSREIGLSSESEYCRFVIQYGTGKYMCPEKGAQKHRAFIFPINSLCFCISFFICLRPRKN